MMDGLTGWDWFVVLSLAVSTALGVLRGLVRSLFGIGAWVAGFVGAPFAGVLLIEQAGLGAAGPWAFAIGFALIYLLVRVAGGLVSGGLRRVGLGGLDRGMGALLGLLRALLIVAVAAVLAHGLGLDRGPAWQQARARPLLEALALRFSPADRALAPRMDETDTDRPRRDAPLRIGADDGRPARWRGGAW